MPLPIRTLTDDVIDKNRFQLVLSNPKTKGYGMVWVAYVWTDWWRVAGLPLAVTVTAEIANALDAPARGRNRTTTNTAAPPGDAAVAVVTIAAAPRGKLEGAIRPAKVTPMTRQALSHGLRP